MKLMNKALIVLAAVSLFSITGCKKNAEEAAKVDEQPAQVQEALTILDWSKGSANSLITSIPEDTMAVFATARSMDLDDPMMKPMLDNYIKALDASIHTYEKQIQDLSPDSPIAKRLNALLDLNKNVVRALFADYANVAPTWGLDPKGHQDTVMYMYNNTPVIKMTVNSVSKFEAKLTELIGEIGKMDPTLKFEAQDVEIENTKWKSYSLMPFANDQDGKCVLCDKDGKSYMPTALAINFGKDGVVTIVLGDKAAIADVQKPTKPSLTADALGKVDSGTIGLGYIDTVKLFNTVTTPAGLAIAKRAGIDEDSLSPVCIGEYGKLLSLFPKLKFSTDVNSASQVVGKSTFVLADKEEVKKLAALHTQSLDILKDSDLASLAINIDLIKTVEYIKELNASAQKMEFACDDLAGLVPAINEVTTLLSNPMVGQLASAINGINIGLSKLNLDAKNADGESIPEIEAVVNISGATLADKLPLLFLMLKGTEFGDMLDVIKGFIPAKGETKTVDLKELAGMPIQINSFLSDTDLLIATQTYDVKAISTAAKKDHKDFIGVAFNMSLLALTGLEIEPELFKTTYNMSIGTNDEGISVDVIMNY